MNTWVIVNDLQIPWHDQPVLDLVVSFVKELRPHGVILNGDVVDCYDLSDFDRNPMKDYGLNREIDASGKLMAALVPVTKERWWLGGNHEDRFRRMLWRNPHLAKVRALRFPTIFHLGDYGFQWKPYGGFLTLGKLMVTHGSQVLKHSGQTGRAHFEKYGTSILIGHTHRLGIYYRRNIRGVHAAYENGCLCRLDPEYVQAPDWQQGFSVVHVDPNKGWFNVQQIPILQRRRFFYGPDLVGKR